MSDHILSGCGFCFLIVICVLLTGPGTLSGQAADIDAKAIIDRADRLLRGESSHGTVEMKVTTRRWKRTLVLDIWSEGTDKALIRILEPRKEKGTATLRVGSQIWNYLPKIDRTIRVPSSMMMGAWMGSHFTNDDLVKKSRLIRDYEIELEFSGDRDGVKVYEIDLRPHEDAPVVWGRILYQIRQDDLMPVWSRFYDEHGELKRTLWFRDYQIMGDRMVPARMTLVPADHPDELTELVYHQLVFDIAIPRRTFSLAALRE